MIKRAQYLRSQIMCTHSRRGWRARLSYFMMEDAKIELALQVAVTRLGFAEVKEKQKEAVVAFVSGKDVFVSAYWLWQVVLHVSTISLRRF